MSNPTVNFTKVRPPIDNTPKQVPMQLPEIFREGIPKSYLWAQCIIVTNIFMANVMILLVGIKDIPFTLSDAVLTAYVVVRLGTPVGLASQSIRVALSNFFGTRSS